MITYLKPVPNRQHYFCTFIIPTKARPTLTNTIQSIEDAWRAANRPPICIVPCFDDVEETISYDSLYDPSSPDLEFYYEVLPVRTPQKLGTGVNGAGLVRKYAYEEFKRIGNSSTWVCFVDDDDEICDTYIHDLYRYLITGHTSSDAVVIFKMRYRDGSVLPPDGFDDITKLENKIGVSFAIASDLADGLSWAPSGGEDYAMLKECRQAGAKFYFSPYVNYLVSPKGIAADRMPK